MTLNQWIVIAIVALVAAALIIIAVPRQKRALPFEVVMGLATWLVAALSAWLLWGATQSLRALQFLALLSIADIPLLPLLVGAFSGALVLTIPLWLMDRSAKYGAQDEEP